MNQNTMCWASNHQNIYRKRPKGSFPFQLRETSSRMLKVTEGRWHTKDPIPRATSDDYFTSRLACELRIFPYRRNIGVVVSIVMEKDRQDVQRKKQKAPLWLMDPRRDAMVAQPSAKGPLHLRRCLPRGVGCRA
jgi:hypothetical protein